MKRLLFTLISFLTLTAGAMADEIKVNSAIRFSFESSFAHAQNVKWSEKDGFAVASFTLNNKSLTAYYEQNGELIVVAQQISDSELPQGLQKEISKKYADGLITTAFKMIEKDGNRHFATVAKGKKEYYLKEVNGRWEVMQVKNL